MVTAKEAKARFMRGEKQLSDIQLGDIERAILLACPNACSITWKSAKQMLDEVKQALKEAEYDVREYAVPVPHSLALVEYNYIISWEHIVYEAVGTHLF